MEQENAPEYIKSKSLCLNPVCVFDFTIWSDKIEDKDEILKHLKIVAKKWCFQFEKGELTGKTHFQGRCSLKLKTRNPPLFFERMNFSVTSEANSRNDFYVSKSETRVAGPWKDTDPEPIYIPRQIRELGGSVLEWQKEVIRISEEWDTRHINIIIDDKGNIGKTMLKGILRIKGLGTPIPFCNDFRDMMRMVMNKPIDKVYLIDIPKAIKKDKLFQMYAGIESLKDGYAYDDRYKFKDKYFDCPNIWVFTNTIPDFSLLSEDRWVIWSVIDGKLVKQDRSKFTAPSEEITNPDDFIIKPIYKSRFS